MLRKYHPAFHQPRFDHIGTDNHLPGFSLRKISVSALPSNSGLLKILASDIISPEKTAQNQHRQYSISTDAITVCDKRPLAILRHQSNVKEVSMLTSCFTL